MRTFAAVCVAGFMTCSCLMAAAQSNQLSIDPRNPAIDYFSAPSDVAAKLDAGLAARELHLEHEANTGYLRALLEALDVPV